MKGLVSSLALLVAGAAAQQSAYGQCGGIGYSGATSCVSGYACQSQNAYYYQCVPGTASATSSTSKASSTSTVKTTSASTSSVDSSHPLELRAGPGALEGFEQRRMKKRDCGDGQSSSSSSVAAKAVSSSPISSAEQIPTPVASSQLAVSSVSAQSSVVTLATSVRSSVKTTTTTSPTKASSSVSTKTSTSAVSTSTGTFAKTDGVLFNIDGETKYYAGTNCYWCGFLTEDEDVDSVFSHMATAGFKIIRVWGFNDVNTIPSSGTVYYQYLSASGSTINTGADGLQRLDAVVAAAEKYDLKLIINFVNNWSDYGGIAAYVSAFGGSATSWFTDSASQAQYQKYIAAVVSRYSTSTAVFSWELANEPRCSGCDTSVIYNWAATTSKYIKSLDANHMVTIGDEGFGPLTGGDGSYPYTTSAGGYTWANNLNITTLDFATLHLYPDSWGQPYAWGDLWITTHGAACEAAGKPCLLEEYGGTNNCTIENPWQQYALNTTGIAADLFWQYGDTLPSSNTQTSQDGNTVYYEVGNWDCMVTSHIAAIDAKYP